jgi:hypothetical protein
VAAAGRFEASFHGKRQPDHPLRLVTVAAVPAMNCPYCGAYADFAIVTNFDSHVGGGLRRYGAWRCSACGQPVIGVVGLQNEPVDYHPRYVADEDFPDVPSAIANDAKEAAKCFGIEAWRASAAMARRALQAAAYDKGAPGGRLIEQIDWLSDKGHITDQMRAVAHQIRLAGNLGAHPDGDGLRDVGPAEAEAILTFLGDFFRYVYEIPASLARISGESQGEA